MHSVGLDVSVKETGRTLAVSHKVVMYLCIAPASGRAASNAPRPCMVRNGSLLVMSLLLIAAAAVPLCISFSALAATIVFARNMLMPHEVPEVPVTVILPATGELPGAEALLD